MTPGTRKGRTWETHGRKETDMAGATSSSRAVEPRVLLDGLAMPESPRWHNGRLWFSNWGADEIVRSTWTGAARSWAAGPTVRAGR